MPFQNFIPVEVAIFFSDRARLRRLTIAISLAVMMGAVIQWNIDHACISMLCRGDFPGFYSAAVVAWQGRWADLYNQNLHQSIQEQFWPDPKGGVYLAVYPPFVSVILAPFALFSGYTAKLIATAISLTLFAIAVMVTAKLLPKLRDATFELAVFLFLWSPVLVGILQGQNTAFSMLFFSLGIAGLSSKSFRGDVITGISFGLWTFKPQFGLLALLFGVGLGRWRVLLFAAIPMLCYYLISCFVMGPFWFDGWLANLALYHEGDRLVNQFQMTSLNGGLQGLIEYFQSHRHTLPIHNIFAYGLSILLFVGSLFLVRKQATTRTLFLLGPVLALASPHALPYDLGIAVLSVVALSEDTFKKNIISMVMLMGLAYLIPFKPTAEKFPFYFCYSLLLYGFCLLQVLRQPPLVKNFDQTTLNNNS